MRPLLPLLLAALLAACASEKPAPKLPSTAPAPKVEATPAYLREISGVLQVPPAGSEVEIALMSVDARDRPQRLLGSLTLKGNGGPLPFRLLFNPEAFPRGERVEFRARAIQSGRLILKVRPQLILQPENQSLGPLQMVPAP
ncbi:YbaY family lipoprotein [Pseudomonas sp. LFM046]|uniref:YbaY family lipoprotein n=1 Tax=Pseudomonas sp. LFM046 TaxID=1608357 RepID=UPI0005CFE61A|nr:YbaY family lipoprotein [Pseudomonas sp. LFM046]